MAKVVRVHQLGGPEVLRIEELQVGDPGPGEVRIRVEAVGLNRAEAMYRAGHYPVKPHLPSLIGYEGVGTIFPQMKVYAYVKKENEELFHNWLRENGHGDLIKAYVFPATLSSFVKEQLEQGVELPDFLSATKVETAMLRRTSKK